MFTKSDPIKYVNAKAMAKATPRTAVHGRGEPPERRNPEMHNAFIVVKLTSESDVSFIFLPGP